MRILALLLLILTPLAAQDLSESRQLAGVVYSQIASPTSATGYEPVSGAEVRLEGTDLSTTTDQKGFFWFKVAPEGQFTLVVRKQGWNEARTPVTVTSGPLPMMAPVVLTTAGATPADQTVFAAFAAREQSSSADPGRIGHNLQLIRAAINAGADPLALYQNLPGLRRAGDFLWNPVTFDANAVMAFRPQAPGLTRIAATPGSPYWVCLNPEGTDLYVSTNQGDIEVRDIGRGNRLADRVPVWGHFVSDLELTPRGIAACLAGQDPRVVIIDTSTRRAVARFPTGGHPRGAVMNREGTRLMVATHLGEVEFIDTATGQVEARVPVGQNPSGLALAPDGRLLYVVNSGNATVSLVDAWSGAPAGRIGVGSSPRRVAVSPDGRRILVTNHNSNTVTVIEGRTHEVLSTVEVGQGPVDVVYTADGDSAFVSCQDAGTIVRLDGRTGALQHTTDPMPLSSPFGLAVRGAASD